MLHYLSTLLFAFWLGCTWLPAPQSGLKQGLTGVVYLQQGNRMPMKGAQPFRKGKGVNCELYVYAPVQLGETQHKGTTITSVPAQAIAVIPTDSNGYFAGRLPAGRYSVLVRWKKVWYADRVNNQGYLNFIEIVAGKEAKREFVIRAGSTY